MLSKSSSAMQEANNTLVETIALETAAVEITRDEDSVGTSFKTVAMRIRGHDGEIVLDVLTDLAEALDLVTKKTGFFGTLAIGGGLFAGFKNVGINMLVAYLSNQYCFELPTI